VVLPAPPLGESWELDVNSDNYAELGSESEAHWATDFLKVDVYNDTNGVPYVIDRVTGETVFLDRWLSRNTCKTWVAKAFGADGLKTHYFECAPPSGKLWISMHDCFVAADLGDRKEAQTWYNSRWVGWSNLLQKLKFDKYSLRKAMPLGDGGENNFGDPLAEAEGRVLGYVTVALPALVTLVASWSHSNTNVCGSACDANRQKAKLFLVKLLHNLPDCAIKVCPQDPSFVAGACVGKAAGRIEIKSGRIDMASLRCAWDALPKKKKPNAARIMPFHTMMLLEVVTVADFLIAVLQAGTLLHWFTFQVCLQIGSALDMHMSTRFVAPSGADTSSVAIVAAPGPLDNFFQEESLSSSARDRTKHLVKYFLEARETFEGDNSAAFMIDAVQAAKKNNMFVSFVRPTNDAVWAPPQVISSI